MMRPALRQRCTEIFVLVILACVLCLPAPGPASAEVTSQQPTSVASALSAAAASGQPVEVPSMTTETEQTFANPDASLTLRQSTAPVRLRRGSGWVPVDTTLVRRPDGTVAPAATPVALAFSGGGSTTPMVRVARAGTSIAWSWPSTLPAPTLAGDTATYADVLPAVDLLLRAQADGFSEVLVVKTAQAARLPALRQIRFASKVSGGTLRAQTGGGFNIIDAVGASVFSSPQPIMWDSAAPPGLAAESAGRDPARAPGEGSRVAPMAEQSDSATVSVSPDQALLGGPGTIFPVYIDPTVSVTRQAWTMVDARYPTTSYYKQTDSSIWGVGYNNTTGAAYTKRLFWNFDTNPVRGKHILSATFSAYEVYAYSCTPAAVYLWQTSALSASTTWNSQPAGIRQLDSKTVAYGRTGCFPAGQSVDFNPTVAIADSAAKGYLVTGLGLRALETSNNYWKRFRYDAVLSINYNTPPAVPTSLRRATTPCYSALDSGVPIVPNDQPQLTANFTDPDGGNLAGLFELFVAPSGTLVKGWTDPAVLSGADQSVTAPSLANGTYFWRVRGYDGVENGSYSVRCYFTVDGNAPPTPTVTAAAGQTYAVGKPASFTFGNGGATDVAKYRWALNDTVPRSADVLASAPTVSITPQHFGPNVLRVWSYDVAGNQSTTYGGLDFSVANGAETAEWSLDEPSGTSVADSAGARTHPMTLAGGATRTSGRWIDSDPTDLAVNFGGVDGAASTSADVVDSSQNFSVSAWVRLSASTVRRVAVGKDATSGSAFTLGFVPGGIDGGGNPVTGSFAFTMANPTGGTEAVARQPLEAVTGDWVHLVGVYQAPTRSLTLYVDGASVGAATLTGTGVQVSGVMTIGRGRVGTAAGNFWAGDVDDVHVFDGAIDDTTAHQLFFATRP